MNGFEFCRKRAGLTQTDTADAMGVKLNTVRAWEAGTSYPTGNKIPALAKLYRCSTDDLYAGAGEKQTSRKELKEIEMREFARKYGLRR